MNFGTDTSTMTAFMRMGDSLEDSRNERVRLENEKARLGILQKNAQRDASRFENEQRQEAERIADKNAYNRYAAAIQKDPNFAPNVNDPGHNSKMFHKAVVDQLTRSQMTEQTKASKLANWKTEAANKQIAFVKSVKTAEALSQQMQYGTAGQDLQQLQLQYNRAIADAYEQVTDGYEIIANPDGTFTMEDPWGNRHEWVPPSQEDLRKQAQILMDPQAFQQSYMNQMMLRDATNRQALANGTAWVSPEGQYAGVSAQMMEANGKYKVVFNSVNGQEPIESVDEARKRGYRPEAEWLARREKNDKSLKDHSIEKYYRSGTGVRDAKTAIPADLKEAYEGYVKMTTDDPSDPEIAVYLEKHPQLKRFLEEQQRVADQVKAPGLGVQTPQQAPAMSTKKPDKDPNGKIPNNVYTALMKYPKQDEGRTLKYNGKTYKIVNGQWTVQ